MRKDQRRRRAAFPDPVKPAFDPQTAGYMLRPNLTDHPVSDLPALAIVAPLVVATATELARFTGQHLIALQTILARAYLEEIFAALCDADRPCSTSFSTPVCTGRRARG